MKINKHYLGVGIAVAIIVIIHLPIVEVAFHAFSGLFWSTDPKEFIYDGHTYIEFEKGVVHSPDCPKCKEVKAENCENLQKNDSN